MKKFRFLIILAALLLAASCGEEQGTVETSAPETTVEETTALIPVESSTVTVENPGWGFPAHSVEVADPNILSAELVKSSWNVNLTSHHVGETEIAVLDCFGHKATIKATVSEDGTVLYEAFPCEEEFISAAKYGITGSKSSSNLPDQSSKLQSLINSVSAKGGGEIFIYPGFYNIKVISMREGVTLRMYSGFTDAREGFTEELAQKVKNGEVTVLILARILNTDFKDYGRNGSSNFTVSGGVIDNDHSTQSTLLFGLSKGITIENMIFKDIKNNHVIQVTGCEDVTIRNCIFAGFEWGGTFTRETIQIEQSHPGAHSGDHANAPVRFDYGETFGCNNVTIDSCYFGPSDELPGHHIAIGHHGSAHEAVCDGFKITNNIFDRPTYAAIRFASITNVEITGNTFTATKNSNKFCDEANPAFIILYPNTGDITHTSIVDGRKIVKGFGFEQAGTHNVKIADNEFTVEKGSDKRIIIVTGTGINPGVVYKENVFRQDTYDGKSFAVTGYFKSTNFMGNIDFSENKITYSGQPAVKDFIFRFQGVYGLNFANNELDLSSCNFARAEDGISGLSKNAVHEWPKSDTYTIQARASNKYVILTHADGTEAKLMFTSTESHTLVAGEGGRIELSGDNRGNVTVIVIAEDGYVFDGWTTENGAFTSSGNVKITAKTTFTANFKKK